MAKETVWRAWYHDAHGESLEQFTEHRAETPRRYRGVVLSTGTRDAVPFRFDYDVLLHPAGTIRRADMQAVTAVGATELTLTADGFGHWFRHGVPVMELTGCLDLSFWCSPQAAAWPLSRLHLDFGTRTSLPLVRISGLQLALEVQHLAYQSDSGNAAGTRYSVTRGDLGPDDVRLDPDGRLVSWSTRWHRV